MAFDFSSLSPADFEDLSRDIIGGEIGVRFEAFAAGPDGGIDGRHSKCGKTTILQAKHYAGSRFSDLKRVMARERLSIDRLHPDRYILSTSFKLTDKNKAALAQEIGPSLQGSGDIFGAADLNALLRKHPEIVKSHFKLWLSSTAMLERVLRAAAQEHGAMTRREIEEKVLVYASNPSFDEARKTLEKHHVLIVAGPPGVGKTTLAEMLVFAHLAEDWELVSIRSLDDGLEEISDLKKQVFYFDDFLGRISLDKSHLARTDSDLARFINRIRKSPNARFILTTRAPIFEEARQFSEHLADKHLDLSRYLLDVGIYTRRIKARILYNHLYLSAVPQAHVNALVLSGLLSKLVDHKNYNPRLIALMTQAERINGIDANAYPTHFLAHLDDPSQLWDIPFRKHIPRTCQHLLISLFFCNQYGVNLEILREVYEAVHNVLAKEYATEKDPKDFTESVKILEGGFIRISGHDVSFVNPSVRDYLSGYLKDLPLLRLLAKSSVRVDFAEAIWRHGERMGLMPSSYELKSLAFAFEAIAPSLAILPVRRRLQSEPMSYRGDDLCNTRRIQLLIDWWHECESETIRAALRSIVDDPVGGWEVWQDGDAMIALIAKFREQGYFDQYVDAPVIADLLEDAAISIVADDYLTLEELDKISGTVDEWNGNIGKRLVSAVNKAIEREFEKAPSVFRDTDSESTLDEHVEVLQRLGKSAGLPEKEIERAYYLASDRKNEIANEAVPAEPITARASIQAEADTFNDAALQDLFAPLLRT
ncbi:hypothetical protein ACC817_08230 [Rhizobium ruizarguesonis]